jgi:glycerol uptake facilitator-like aquaporin
MRIHAPRLISLKEWAFEQSEAQILLLEYSALTPLHIFLRQLNSLVVQPSPNLIVDEFVASAMLMFVIYALTDQGNMAAGNLTPLMLFFLVFAIGVCLGWQTGYAVGPCRTKSDKD